MKNKEKAVIRVQPLYTYVIIIFFTALFIIFIISPKCFWGWETEGVDYIINCILFGSGAACFIVMFLYYIQFAIIDEKGIRIWGLFYKIADVKWNEIYAIKSRILVTHKGRIDLDYDWLVITDKDHYRSGTELAGINQRNKFQYYIIATKKNRDVIGKYYKIDNVHF